MAEKKLRGAAIPKYTDPAEMKQKIDEYFETCEGEVLIDAEGNPVLNKYGEVVMVHQRPFTTAGLALALGFKSRQGLFNYKGRTKEFKEILDEALLRIEQYAEERLYDRDGSNGAKFNLQNNFKGWTDAAKETATAAAKAVVKIVNDIPREKPKTAPAETTESANNADTDTADSNK